MPYLLPLYGGLFFFGIFFPFFLVVFSRFLVEGRCEEGRKEGRLLGFCGFCGLWWLLGSGLVWLRGFCGFCGVCGVYGLCWVLGFLDLVACVPSVATWLLWLVWLMFFRGFLVFYGFRGFYGFEVVECFNMSLPFLPVKMVCNRKQRQNWRKRIE